MDLNVALRIEVAKRRLVQLWFPMQFDLSGTKHQAAALLIRQP